MTGLEHQASARIFPCLAIAWIQHSNARANDNGIKSWYYDLSERPVSLWRKPPLL